MSLLTLKLKPTKRARVMQGHPWVFASEIADALPDVAQGQGVRLEDAKGRFMGCGIYNGQSQIVWRRYSRKERPFDATFLKQAIEKSVASREAEHCCRLIWSEADGLPGLVVDKFNDVLVVQALTLAMDKALPDVVEILQTLIKPAVIIGRNDAPSREHEGLPLETKTLAGEKLDETWVGIDGFQYLLDFYGSHKTGFYLDQRGQHMQVGRYAKGRRVLDAFCNQGAFAMHCARAGAESVLAVDISEQCCELARKNVACNELNVEVQQANMFDWFSKNKRECYDLIVLDPPSFARNKRAVPGAVRGYKELNLRALKMLNPGGILATYSCSQSIDETLFFDVLREAAGDAKLDVRLLGKTGQPSDHPVLINAPETHYLKGAILEV